MASPELDELAVAETYVKVCGKLPTLYRTPTTTRTPYQPTANFNISHPNIITADTSKYTWPTLDAYYSSFAQQLCSAAIPMQTPPLNHLVRVHAIL